MELVFNVVVVPDEPVWLGVDTERKEHLISHIVWKRQIILGRILSFILSTWDLQNIIFTSLIYISKIFDIKLTGCLVFHKCPNDTRCVTEDSECNKNCISEIGGDDATCTDAYCSGLKLTYKDRKELGQDHQYMRCTRTFFLGITITTWKVSFIIWVLHRSEGYSLDFF